MPIGTYVRLFGEDIRLNVAVWRKDSASTAVYVGCIPGPSPAEVAACSTLTEKKVGVFAPVQVVSEVDLFSSES